MGYIIEMIVESLIFYSMVAFFYAFIFKLVIRLIKYLFFRSKAEKKRIYFKSNNIASRESYTDLSEKDLQVFNISNIHSLKEKLFDIFLKFENAYNSLDYGMMKHCSTKVLFKNYYEGIKLETATNKKRVIENIKKNDIKIFDIQTTSICQRLFVMIDISYLNYVVDSKGILISGQKLVPVKEKFEVVFIKYYDQKNIEECPNCGANVKSDVCEYCRTLIDNEEFKINSIKKII